MKKIISIIASSLLLFQTFAPAVYADDWDDLVAAGGNITGVYDEIVEEDNTAKPTEVKRSAEYEKLLAFGFADEVSGSTLTRAQFVTMAMRSVANGNVTADTQIFADVPLTHTAAGYITAAYRMGVISGSDGLFEPEKPISAIDAIVIAVRLLGRDREAAAKGGYPTGYIQTAKSCDITDGADIGNYLLPADKDTLYAIMANTVECTRFAVNDGFENGEAVYNSDKTTNILSFYHDIYTLEGIVNAVGSSNILGTSVQKADAVTVGSTSFDAEYESYIAMLGMNVTAYYRENGGKNELVCIDADDNNRVITLKDGDITDCENGKYTYYVGSVRKTASLAKDASVMYNGRIIEKSAKEYYVPENGTVTLIDNNGNGIYDVAAVENAEDLTVASVDAAESKFYDRYDRSLAVSFKNTDPDYVRSLVNTDGKVTYPAMVKAGNIISVIRSADGLVIKGVVSSTAVNGTITEIENTSDLYVTVGEKRYRVTDKCADRCKTMLSLGTAVSLRLNANGDVADVTGQTSEDGTMKFAYVIRYGKESDGLSADYGVKLLDEDGKIAVHMLKDNCKIDGTACRSDAEKTAALARGTSIGSVIKFAADAEGLVSDIDTAYQAADEDKDTTLRKLYNTTDPKLRHKSAEGGGGSFGERFVWNWANTKVFTVYADQTTDEKKYRVATSNGSSPFVNDENYSPEAYRSADSFYVNALVREITSSAGSVANRTLWIVEDIRKRSSDYGTSTALVITNGSARKTVSGDAEAFDGKDIDIGDIVRCDEVDGEIIGSSIKKTYDLSEDKMLERNSETTSEDLQFIRKGYVYDVKGDLIQYSVNMADTENLKLVRSITAMYSVEMNRLGEVDVKKVGISDLLSYVSCGGECSKIIVHYQYQLPQQIFIIK